MIEEFRVGGCTACEEHADHSRHFEVGCQFFCTAVDLPDGDLADDSGSWVCQNYTRGVSGGFWFYLYGEFRRVAINTRILDNRR